MSATQQPIPPRLRELQQLIASGDDGAFTQLYLHFGKKLVQFAITIVRSKEVAEELVEDVFVNIWSGRAGITDISNITVYLYVSVKNRALNTLSRKARELVTAPFDYLDTPLDEFAADPYDLMITAEMMARMRQAIDSLPPRCKMIFKLIRENGLRYKEVSEVLNISVNTIDAQMAIAVRKICNALEIQRSVKAFNGGQLSEPVKKVKKS